MGVQGDVFRHALCAHTLHGADGIVPIDSEGSGKWGLDGNGGGVRGIKVEKVKKVGFAVHRASFVFFKEPGQVFGRLSRQSCLVGRM